MKLSTRSRYGLKAVVDLAVYYGEKPVTLSTLASLQGVAEAYLEQLLRALRKAGIVDTVRGAARRLLPPQRVANLLRRARMVGRRRGKKERT